MTDENLKIQVPGEDRHIAIRLSRAENTARRLRQLVIMATGLCSHMDKPSQVKIAESYQKAGFNTLQFNFMGHGVRENKSEGELRSLTISDSIKDLKATWDYAQKLPDTDPTSLIINANSYGAYISMLTLEKKLIKPESMILVAPFSTEKYKPWVLPLRVWAKISPDQVIRQFKHPIPKPMLFDFLNHYTHGIERNDLLGNTAVHFFIGDADTVASPASVKKWCAKFNAVSPKIPFVDNLQAHHIIYPGVPHLEFPETVQKDIMDRSIAFIRQTHNLRTR